MSRVDNENTFEKVSFYGLISYIIIALIGFAFFSGSNAVLETQQYGLEITITGTAAIVIFLIYTHHSHTKSLFEMIINAGRKTSNQEISGQPNPSTNNPLKSMEYNNQTDKDKLKCALTNGFDETGFSTFVKDFYTDVSNQFGADMKRARKIEILFDYCELHEIMEELHKNVKSKAAPAKYMRCFGIKE